MDPDVLATHTLGELLSSTIGDVNATSFYHKFAYYSEIHVLRADVALHSFSNEMGSAHFGGCKEGLSSLINAMRDEFISLGGTIITGITVVKIHKNTVYCHDKFIAKEFIAKNIVLCRFNKFY